MKKNLLSIIILALLLVNTVMTGFMMLTLVTTNNQAVKLIGDVAAALQIEANGGTNGQGFSGSATGNVAIENVASYTISDMTITLKDSGDGQTHYMLATVVLSMDNSTAEYATYGSPEAMATYEDQIKAKITEVIGSYTIDEIKEYEDEARATILEKIQELFGSNFIYDISFSSKVYQ